MRKIYVSKHYITPVGDGVNFVQTSHIGLWAVKSKNCIKILNNELKPNDKIWFICNTEPRSGKYGKIMAVADFQSKNERNTGPLIALTPSNEELGWKGKRGGQSDTEIHYTNLYNLMGSGLYTGLTHRSGISRYDSIKLNEKCLVDLPELYNQITNGM
jgi:hypothetical protein